MKKLYSLVIASASACMLQAQTYCGTPRYDLEVFPSSYKISNVVYGSNTTVNGSPQTLVMDIYQPSGDTAGKRPLIIFAHGGSFLGGSKNDGDQVTLACRFARRGYVCATIDYRVGWGFPIDSVNGTKAVIRATQDMKAAVRFFKQDASTVNAYKVDTSYIYAGGTSAGAFMGLHLAYLDQLSEVPSWINIASLGGLEGNSGNPGYSSKVRGVINLCGALGDSTWIVNGDVPMVSMHGTNDNTVPYGKAMIYVLGFPIMIVCGSSALDARCSNVGVTSVFHTWPGQDHVPYVASAVYMDSTVAFVSNFIYSDMGCTPTYPTALPPSAGACQVTAGIDDLSEPLSFELYPNPSNGTFSIELNELVQQFALSLSDITGRVIMNEDIFGNAYEFENKNLTSGVYLLKISSGKKSRTEKIVIY